METKEKDLRKRTKDFALRVYRMVESLPANVGGGVFGKQILRSATAVGANYRSACRARSKADFISKISIVEEEADETIYWLELINESGLMNSNRIGPLIDEARELTAIFTTARKTARSSILKKN